MSDDFENSFTAKLSKKFATLLINNSHRILNTSLSCLEKYMILKIAKFLCI